MIRHGWLSLAFLAFVASSSLGAEDVTIRISTSNLSSGDQQSYDPGQGIRILRALDSDIVLMQEFRYLKSPIPDLVSQIAGPRSWFYREAAYQGVTALPNGIISRFPIKQAGSWNDPQIYNRGFAWARIDIPGDRDLLAVSLHIKSGDRADTRALEAEALVARIKEALGQDEYLLIGGDLNTEFRTEDCIRVLSEVVSTAGPYPADQNGVDGTNAIRQRPSDWLLADDRLDALEVPVVLGGTKFPTGLVFDSRVDPPVVSRSEVSTSDCGSACVMQHMAVVRDFKLTVTTPQATAAIARPAAPVEVRGADEQNGKGEYDPDIAPAPRAKGAPPAARAAPEPEPEPEPEPAKKPKKKKIRGPGRYSGRN